MDVEPKPGPPADPTSTPIRSSELSFIDLHLNTATRHYSRDKILSLRPFAYSPKCLSSELMDLLQNLKILKYRGKRAGRSYEHLDPSINYGKSNTRLQIVYRPPPSKDNGFTGSMFFDELSKHLELIALD